MGGNQSIPARERAQYNKDLLATSIGNKINVFSTRHLNNTTATLLAEYKSSQQISCISFSSSPGVDLLAASSLDGSVIVIALNTGKIISKCTVSDSKVQFSCCCFSADSKTILAGTCQDKVFPNSLRFFDVESGKQQGNAVLGHHSPLTCCASSEKAGGIYVTADSNGEIIVWNAMSKKRKILESIQVVDTTSSSSSSTSAVGGCNGISISPDGIMVAAAFDSKIIYCFQTANGEKICELKGHGANVNCISFVPEHLAGGGGHNQLVSGGDDNSCFVFDVVKNKVNGESFGDVKKFVTAITVHPVSPTVAVGYSDASVRFYDLQNHEQIGSSLVVSTNRNDAVKSIEFASDGIGQTFAICCGKSCMVFDFVRGTLMQNASEIKVESNVTNLKFDDDGKNLSVTTEKGITKEINLASQSSSASSS